MIATSYTVPAGPATSYPASQPRPSMAFFFLLALHGLLCTISAKIVAWIDAYHVPCASGALSVNLSSFPFNFLFVFFRIGTYPDRIPMETNSDTSDIHLHVSFQFSSPKMEAYWIRMETSLNILNIYFSVSFLFSCNHWAGYMM